MNFIISTNIKMMIFKKFLEVLNDEKNNFFENVNDNIKSNDDINKDEEK